MGLAAKAAIVALVALVALLGQGQAKDRHRPAEEWGAHEGRQVQRHVLRGRLDLPAPGVRPLHAHQERRLHLQGRPRGLHGAAVLQMGLTFRNHSFSEYTRAGSTWMAELQFSIPAILSAWANTSAEMKESVVLGHFVLPPACLQEEIRRKIGGFIWEQMDDSLAEQRPNEDLQPNEDLPDEAEMVRKDCKQDVREDVQNLSESSEENPGSRASTQGEFSYHALKEYPMNNMVTGYTSARDMKKYVGELRDFIPGTSGYTAYWIQNEIKVYSDVKTKMKRKL
uniref:Telomere repeat binding bouquet formation protein 2 n=1 Tax=Anas platyrhynchos TaxID=8839 RepID=A0A8B9SXJ9_ANAPL